jgi:flagellar hook-length control protein FliK
VPVGQDVAAAAAAAKPAPAGHRAAPAAKSGEAVATTPISAGGKTQVAAAAIKGAADLAGEWIADSAAEPAPTTPHTAAANGPTPHAQPDVPAVTAAAAAQAAPVSATAPPVKTAPAAPSPLPGPSPLARSTQDQPSTAATDTFSVNAGTPTTAPQAAAAPHAGTQATPAGQIAHAVAVHIPPSASGNVTIHLQPAELGAVQVRIERAHDGTATVTVQVEKSETLHSLQQDMPRLHQALDRAGLPTEARQVTLHLAAASGSDTQTGLGNGGDGQRQGPAARQPQRAAPAPPSETADDETAPVWRAAGINITA